MGHPSSGPNFASVHSLRIQAGIGSSPAVALENTVLPAERFGRWEDAVGQLFLGSTAWIERMRSLIEAKPRSSEHPSAQRYAARPRPAKIMETVASVFMKKEGDIRN